MKGIEHKVEVTGAEIETLAVQTRTAIWVFAASKIILKLVRFPLTWLATS